MAKACRPRSLRTLSTVMLVPLASFAQAKPDEKPKETELPSVKVEAPAIDPNPNAQPGVPYKAATSGDARHTRPLAETPQTIQVITGKAIEESGQTDLRAILNAQPGITIGTGENGNQFGDRYIIRGQEARSDVFVDGLRDPGMTTRESFAIEQLEITKGPNSSFAGRGSAGGAVNAVTKQASTAYDFARLTAAGGTDRHARLTADVNQMFGDNVAVRANLLYGNEDVPGRAPADRDRRGLALAGVYEAGSSLSVGLDYYHLRAKDKPDTGTWLVGTVPDRKPRADAPVYLQEPDFLRSDVDTFTGRIRWSATPEVTLTNLTRYGAADNGYVVTGARAANAFAGSTPYSSATLSTHNGWQEVDYFANQTNVQFDRKLFGRRNELVLSLEYTDHKVLKGVYAVANAGAFNCRTAATATANNAYCIYRPDGTVVDGLGSLMGRQVSRGEWNADWRVKTWAVSAMDTLDLTDRFTVFGGVRLDRYDFGLGIRAATGAESWYDASDNLLNGHFGLTYRLAPDTIAYAGYGTAEDINGGESDVGTNSGYGGAVIYNGRIAGADPEKSRNAELGIKWDAFDHGLLLTAALFQVRKSGVMEGADYDSAGTFNTGANQVRGIELGAVGQLTERLTGQAGVAFMKSKVTRSFTAANVGRALSNFAEKSAWVQLNYKAGARFNLGGTVTYESGKCAGQPDSAAGVTADGRCSQPIPGFTKLDLFALYRFSPSLNLRLNVLNATDRDYYLAAYRSGSFVYIGDARAYRATLSYEF